MDENSGNSNIAQDPPIRSSKKRARSQAERATVNKDKYKLLPPCKDSCKKKCYEKFSSETRNNINSNFWSLDFEGRRLWFDGHIYISTVKRYRAQQRNRHFTSILSLPSEALPVTVCKNMFLAIFEMKSNAFILYF